MAFDLTLLGFSPVSSPVLAELAAEAWAVPVERLRVQIVHNLPMPVEHGWPEDWPEPSCIDLTRWRPGPEDGITMPGVMHEPAVSEVMKAVMAATDFDFSHLGVIVHPTAAIAPSAQLGPGTWVHAMSTVAAFSQLGPCCHVNRNASVGHHNLWGAFSRINPGAHTAGLCQIGDRVTIGIGAALRQGVHVGDGATVGGGSMVLKHVEAGATVVGNPARPLVKSAPN